MSIERIQLSQQAKDQLLKLKRNTGVKQWNVLCRWAFCTSLAETSAPPRAKIPADSNVEMSFKVFGGPHHEIYMALLKARCQKDGLGADEETLGQELRLHLHRGIGYLFADRRIQRIGDMFKRLPVGEGPLAREARGEGLDDDP